jgi:hypothetical protein
MLASMMLGLWMADAMATPTIGDCGSDVPDPTFTAKTCEDVCELVALPSGQFSVDCDMGVAGPPTDPFALAVSSVGAAEFVVLGNGLVAAIGSTQWCCEVQDDAFEVIDLSVMGTTNVDDIFFACGVAGSYGGCSATFNLSNPNPSPTDVFTGRQHALANAGALRDSLVGSNIDDDFYRDELFGSSKSDEINGLGGDDWLFGMEGDDLLSGGGGNDVIQGMDGADTMNGQGGDDTLYGDHPGGGTAADIYVGGLGSDNFCDDDGGTNGDRFDGDPVVSTALDRAWVEGTTPATSNMDGTPNECNVNAASLAGCTASVVLADVCPTRPFPTH